jgi:hypothetical protein
VAVFDLAILPIWAFIMLLVCLPLLASSVASSADDIALQVGGQFSVYAPSSCRRGLKPNFALVLECDFKGKEVRFYVKEFPAQLSEDHPRKFAPSKLNQEAYRNSAIRAFVDELDPRMWPHLKFLSRGSNSGDDVDALFWQGGYLFGEDARDYENIRKCVFLSCANLPPWNWRGTLRHQRH